MRGALLRSKKKQTSPRQVVEAFEGPDIPVVKVGTFGIQISHEKIRGIWEKKHVQFRS
jgi:hypothetical protein